MHFKFVITSATALTQVDDAASLSCPALLDGFGSGGGEGPGESQHPGGADRTAAGGAVVGGGGGALAAQIAGSPGGAPGGD